MFKIATLLSLPLLAGLAVSYATGGLVDSEIVPVLQKGETVYAVRCIYRAVTRETAVEVAPVAYDWRRLKGAVCPNRVEDADAMRVIQSGT